MTAASSNDPTHLAEAARDVAIANAMSEVDASPPPDRPYVARFVQALKDRGFGVTAHLSRASSRARLDLVEALLREHWMHEASCPVRRAQVHNARGMSYMFPGECDCWLGPATVDVGPATVDVPPASAP